MTTTVRTVARFAINSFNDDAAVTCGTYRIDERSHAHSNGTTCVEYLLFNQPDRLVSCPVDAPHLTPCQLDGSDVDDISHFSLLCPFGPVLSRLHEWSQRGDIVFTPGGISNCREDRWELERFGHHGTSYRLMEVTNFYPGSFINRLPNQDQLNPGRFARRFVIGDGHVWLFAADSVEEAKRKLSSGAFGNINSGSVSGRIRGAIGTASRNVSLQSRRRRSREHAHAPVLVPVYDAAEQAKYDGIIRFLQTGELPNKKSTIQPILVERNFDLS